MDGVVFVGGDAHIAPGGYIRSGNDKCRGAVSAPVWLCITILTFSTDCNYARKPRIIHTNVGIIHKG